MSKSTAINPTTAKLNIYQVVTDRILASLKNGIIPWQKPWQAPTFAGGIFPRNFRTGKPYRGVNVFLLWSSQSRLANNTEIEGVDDNERSGSASHRCGEGWIIDENAPNVTAKTPFFRFSYVSKPIVLFWPDSHHGFRVC
jgi:hypothetical protein